MKQEDFFTADKRALPGCKFFSDNQEFSLNHNNFPQVFFEIVGLFAEDCQGELFQIECLSGVLLIGGMDKEGVKKSKLYLNFTAGRQEEFFRNTTRAMDKGNEADADVAFGIDPVNVTASQGGYTGPVTANFPEPRIAGLVIENVEFIHQRRGYMTRLFEILKRIQAEYSLGPIKMKNVLSDKMKAWCEKQKLDKMMADRELNYYYYGDKITEK